MKEISEEKRWLFDPANKEILERPKERFLQEVSFDLGFFKKDSKIIKQHTA